MRTEFDTRDDRTMALGTAHLDEQRVTLMEVPGELQNALNALRVQKVLKRTPPPPPPPVNVPVTVRL